MVLQIFIYLGTDNLFYGVHLTHTPGQHGSGEILLKAGNVCGVIFRHPTEKTLYIAGDTIYYEGVVQTVLNFQPQVIIVNSGGNQFLDSHPLIMGKEDVYELHKTIPKALLVASHMEAVNHWMLSKKELAAFAEAKHFSSHLRIPDDGQVLYL